jgi:phosphoribosyl 1,2-cyclic phosphodiesterase
MLATDCGEPNEEMEAGIRMANHIVIEANHDEHLLLNGTYPTYLKDRILSPRGHQSNDTCGRLLAENFHNGLRNIFLCHLSQENNRPEIAFETVESHLSDIGYYRGEDFFLKVLDRTNPSPVYTLNNDIITEY